MIQLDAFGGTFQISKKGTIDLVTDVDLAVERMVRALIAERHPGHDVLAEELGGPVTRTSPYCWICDPIDGITNVRGMVMLALWDAFKREGIEIPYPMRDLQITKPVRVVIGDEQPSAG